MSDLEKTAATKLSCFPRPDRNSIDERLRQAAFNAAAPKDEGLLSISDADLCAGFDDATFDALAQVIRILACGEESAIHVFYREGDRIGASPESYEESQSLMYRIAKEEEFHDAMLTRASRCLPCGAHHLELRKTAQRFYISLMHQEPKYHFFRITELDSAVCIVMSGLLGETGRLRISPAWAKMAYRIRNDEAGHVRVCRGRVNELGLTSSERFDEADSLRPRLVRFLSNAEAAFAALGVDPELLFKRILQRRVT